MKSQRSETQVTYTKSGLKRFVIHVSHKGLNQYQAIRATSRFEAEQKALAKMAQWDQRWERKQEAAQRKEHIEKAKESAAQRTKDAQQSLSDLETILSDGLKLTTKQLLRSTKPDKPDLPGFSPEPLPEDAAYNVELTFMQKILDVLAPEKKRSREDQLRASYEHDHANWEKQLQDYSSGKPKAVLRYCLTTLSKSRYPKQFPRSGKLHYNASTKMLMVDYQLPAPDDLPTLREVRYVQSRDEFDEKHISDDELRRRYDQVLYQIVLRTLHELLALDKAEVIEAIVFNGFVDSIDPSTGQEVYACIISVMAKKDEFLQINLENVDPKACFKKLKGVGSSKLHSLTPVAPVLVLDREDKRFIEGYKVVDGLQEGDNLAAMDWEDFEHLVRELFEKEFSGPNSEVKVTRASRDGGIDAVVFDPDPLHGGKVVIQAKRYTNTVGVSAVRDLYGSVMNEGANKGILVTTSDYGPDAHQFAKDKPLVLLSGSNLLHLLQKHGHKAYIDLKEAKSILAEDK